MLLECACTPQEGQLGICSRHTEQVSLCLTVPSLQLYSHTPVMGKVLPGLSGMEGVMLV